MESRKLPKILSSRSLSGVAAQYSRRNMAWNDDGQLLLVTRQAVTIATPYLTTTLNPPSVQIDSALHRSLNPGAKINVKEEEEDEDDEAIVVDMPQSTTHVLQRPEGGEVRWWMTAAVSKGRGNDEEYGWSGLGDEVTGIMADRDRLIRSAVWSPSGLNEMGGCLLVVLSNHGVVTVHGPKDDAYNQEFNQIADLSIATLELLGDGEIEDDTPTLQGMLRMRKTALEWSPPGPQVSMIGIDGSILALANRAGQVELWTYEEGRFGHLISVNLPRPFATELTWSAWHIIDEQTCMARLAAATSDGGVYLLPVTRKSLAETGTWDLTVSPFRTVHKPDHRAVNGVKWITEDTLVWTKPGTVSIWSKSWDAPKTLRLGRVGNWAGCNALSQAMGIHFVAPNTLNIVLSTLTHHVITDIFTSPRQVEDASLRATLSARDIFLDGRKRRRRTFYAASDAELTANTGGYAAIDGPGDIVGWIAEPVNFHNLDNATEVNRAFDFVTADLRASRDGAEGAGSEAEARVQRLKAAFEQPPSLLHRSPLAVLVPHLLGLIALNDTSTAVGSAVLALLSPHDIPQIAVPTSTPGTDVDSKRALMGVFWGNPRLDALRLALVVSQWGERAWPTLAADFRAASLTLHTVITRVLVTATARWAANTPLADSMHVDGDDDRNRVDEEFLAHLVALADSDAAAQVQAVAADSVPCPACGAGIEFGATPTEQVCCANGHDWERCSVTSLLITTPEYRVCTVCPAVSLVPASWNKDDDGHSASGGGDKLAQMALDAAVACVMCGGRWARPV